MRETRRLIRALHAKNIFHALTSAALQGGAFLSPPAAALAITGLAAAAAVAAGRNEGRGGRFETKKQ
jgi:hypothetical protein